MTDMLSFYSMILCTFNYIFNFLNSRNSFPTYFHSSLIKNVQELGRSFFFIFSSLLEYNCFTMLCQFLLYNKVNQLYVFIYPHIPSLLSLPPTLPIPPLQVVTQHPADLPVLCSSFPLVIYFTFGCVYMSMPLSHFVLASLPTPCPQVHSLHLRLYSCPATRFISTIF